MADLIDRAKAIKAIEDMQDCYNGFSGTYDKAQIIGVLEEVPSAEPLTDNEKRIFLAAMGREEKVCKEIDKDYVREAYEDSIVWVCKEIKRKVKAALWGQDCNGEVNK